MAVVRYDTEGFVTCLNFATNNSGCIELTVNALCLSR